MSWSALGLAGVRRGMSKHRETSQEELEWMRLTEDLALEHRRKLLANGYSPPFEISTWWAERQVLELQLEPKRWFRGGERCFRGWVAERRVRDEINAAELEAAARAGRPAILQWGVGWYDREDPFR